MTTTATFEPALRQAIRKAVLAPSLHNSQPWRFVLAPAAVEIVADRHRQLDVLDPTGRQLILSAGCALFNLRASLAASRLVGTVTRWPDSSRPDLLARIAVTSTGAANADIAVLDPAIDSRQTNRRQFVAQDVPESLIATLVAAAVAEGAVAHQVVKADDRQSLARLSQLADSQQLVDGAYRAELRKWTTEDDERRDGVRPAVVPHVDGSARDELPLRDFDTQGHGALPADTRSSSQQCLLVLGTETDSPDSWLHAGEALERIWLEITRAGFVASVFTQVIEQPALREQLRAELRLAIHPHIIVRVGHAAATAASRRRPLNDMLDCTSP